MTFLQLLITVFVCVNMQALTAGKYLNVVRGCVGELERDRRGSVGEGECALLVSQSLFFHHFDSVVVVGVVFIIVIINVVIVTVLIIIITTLLH
jgi:hypothetical protein